MLFKVVPQGRDLFPFVKSAGRADLPVLMPWLCAGGGFPFFRHHGMPKGRNLLPLLHNHTAIHARCLRRKTRFRTGRRNTLQFYGGRMGFNRSLCLYDNTPTAPRTSIIQNTVSFLAFGHRRIGLFSLNVLRRRGEFMLSRNRFKPVKTFLLAPFSRLVSRVHTIRRLFLAYVLHKMDLYHPGSIS